MPASTVTRCTKLHSGIFWRSKKNALLLQCSLDDCLVGAIPTPLKNISQWEGLSHILWKNKIHVPNLQPVVNLWH